MNTKNLTLTLLVLAVTALAGCKSDSSADASTSSTSANGQPMTGGDASGNAAANPGNTNMPAATSQ
jgi:hypothetical protein